MTGDPQASFTTQGVYCLLARFVYQVQNRFRQCANFENFLHSKYVFLLQNRVTCCIGNVVESVVILSASKSIGKGSGLNRAVKVTGLVSHNRRDIHLPICRTAASANDERASSCRARWMNQQHCSGSRVDSRLRNAATETQGQVAVPAHPEKVRIVGI